MIPRILVPKKLLPATAETAAPPQRTSTSLDDRLLVPQELPVVALDARSNIPSHVPLDVLGERTVVPRNLPLIALQVKSDIPTHVPLTILDSRVAVPTDARPAELKLGTPLEIARARDILEPDVLTTGEVNLLVSAEEEVLPMASWIPRWVAPAGTVTVHVAILALALLSPRLFPYRPPTQAELEMATRSLGMIYVPPPMENVPRVAPSPGEQSPRMHIDPRVLKQILPPNAEPVPLPGPPVPPRVQAELPNAPRPQIPADSGRQPEGQPRVEPPREIARLENVKPSDNTGSLIIPKMSPGRSIDESLRGATRGGSQGPSGAFGDRPRSGGAGSPYGGGGGTDEGMFGTFEMLTPTEGVDFTNYLARVLASIKRNWYAVIPESARLGERGRVVLQFRILRDGNVPQMEPRLLVTSTKEHLDRAAMSSIRASSPFETLPPAFSGPFIELRITYLYNLPIDYR